MGEQEPLRVPPQVATWARDTVEEKPKPEELATVPSGTGDFSYRVIPRTDVSGLEPLEGQRFDELTRELTAIDRDYKERRPLVRGGIFEFTDDHPGIMGTVREPGKGNFKVTVVPQREVMFDDAAIKPSLGERAEKVYIPQIAHQFAYEGRLVTVDGRELSPERVLAALKHAMLGLGVSEEFVDENFIKREAERRDARLLAQAILDGVAVEGITVDFTRRIEIRDVDKFKPVRVRRPRRKRIILKNKQPG